MQLAGDERDFTFFAAALKASRCVMSGLPALMRWISSLQLQITNIIIDQHQEHVLTEYIKWQEPRRGCNCTQRYILSLDLT
jgi:hypothetical protein